MLVAPSSAASTWPTSWRKRSSRGARPPVDRPKSPSPIRPASINWATRWVMAVRPSPVTLPSSGFVVAVPLRTRSSTVTRWSNCSASFWKSIPFSRQTYVCRNTELAQLYVSTNLRIER